MKLPKAILAKLPKLGSTKNVPLAEQVAVLKLFGGSNSTWLLCEYDGKDTFFGFCAPMGMESGEWGYVSLAELQSLKFPPFGLGIERDSHFKPTKVSEIL